MANKRISFVVDFTTEFGAAFTALKVKICDTKKSQFEAALNVLPKWILNTWEAITFPFEEEKIEYNNTVFKQNDFIFILNC